MSKSEPAPERPLGYSLGAASRAFGVHEERIYRAEKAGKLIGIRIGNRVWYSGAQLQALFGEPDLNVTYRRAA